MADRGDEDEVILDYTGKGLNKIDINTGTWPTTLIYDKNSISKIEKLEEYSRLQQLSIASNRLVRMIGVLKLTNLTVLNLPNNSIVTIEGLRDLTKLTWLNLSGNSIKNIENLIKNVQLKHLDLSDNSIANIADISYLKTLKTLLLHGNIITSLENVPKSLPQSLTILSLAENEISDLNEVSHLSCLQSLEQLSIMNNPCVMMTGSTRGFDYRPFVLNCCLNLRIIDGYLVTEKEWCKLPINDTINKGLSDFKKSGKELFDLQAEWLYSQGKGRHFKPGQHVQLVNYLAYECPLTAPCKLEREDNKLKKVLSKQHLHQKQLLSETLTETLLNQHINKHSPQSHTSSPNSAKSGSPPSAGNKKEEPPRTPQLYPMETPSQLYRAVADQFFNVNSTSSVGLESYKNEGDLVLEDFQNAENEENIPLVSDSIYLPVPSGLGESPTRPLTAPPGVSPKTTFAELASHNTRPLTAEMGARQNEHQLLQDYSRNVVVKDMRNSYFDTGDPGIRHSYLGSQSVAKSVDHENKPINPINQLTNRRRLAANLPFSPKFTQPMKSKSPEIKMSSPLLIGAKKQISPLKRKSESSPRVHDEDRSDNGFSTKSSLRKSALELVKDIAAGRVTKKAVRRSLEKQILNSDEKSADMFSTNLEQERISSRESPASDNVSKSANSQGSTPDKVEGKKNEDSSTYLSGLKNVSADRSLISREGNSSPELRVLLSPRVKEKLQQRSPSHSSTSSSPLTSPVKVYSPEKYSPRPVKCYLKEQLYTSYTPGNHNRAEQQAKLQKQALLRRLSLMDTKEVNKKTCMIQALWRGYRARKYNPRIIAVREEIRVQRSESHIKELSEQLNTVKNNYDHEKQLRILQLEAVKQLWQEVQDIQSWKKKNVDMEKRYKNELETKSMENIALIQTCSSLKQDVVELKGKVKSLTDIVQNLDISKSSAVSHSTVSAPSNDSIVLHDESEEEEDEAEEEEEQERESTKTEPKIKPKAKAKPGQWDSKDLKMPSSQESINTLSQVPYPGTPTTPGNLRLEHKTIKSIVLKWEPSVVLDEKGLPMDRPILGYRIFINDIPRGMVSGKRSKALVEGLDSSFYYKLYVKSVSALGESYASNMVLAQVKIEESHSSDNDSDDDGDDDDDDDDDDSHDPDKDHDSTSKDQTKSLRSEDQGSTSTPDTSTNDASLISVTVDDGSENVSTSPSGSKSVKSNYVDSLQTFHCDGGKTVLLRCTANTGTVDVESTLTDIKVLADINIAMKNNSNTQGKTCDLFSKEGNSPERKGGKSDSAISTSLTVASCDIVSSSKSFDTTAEDNKALESMADEIGFVIENDAGEKDQRKVLKDSNLRDKFSETNCDVLDTNLKLNSHKRNVDCLLQEVKRASSAFETDFLVDFVGQPADGSSSEKETCIGSLLSKISLLEKDSEGNPVQVEVETENKLENNSKTSTESLFLFSGGQVKQKQIFQFNRNPRLNDGKNEIKIPSKETTFFGCGNTNVVETDFEAKSEFDDEKCANLRDVPRDDVNVMKNDKDDKTKSSIDEAICDNTCEREFKNLPKLTTSPEVQGVDNVSKEPKCTFNENRNSVARYGIADSEESDESNHDPLFQSSFHEEAERVLKLLDDNVVTGSGTVTESETDAESDIGKFSSRVTKINQWPDMCGKELPVCVEGKTPIVIDKNMDSTSKPNNAEAKTETCLDKAIPTPSPSNDKVTNWLANQSVGTQSKGRHSTDPKWSVSRSSEFKDSIHKMGTRGESDSEVRSSVDSGCCTIQTTSKENLHTLEEKPVISLSFKKPPSTKPVKYSSIPKLRGSPQRRLTLKKRTASEENLNSGTKFSASDRSQSLENLNYSNKTSPVQSRIPRKCAKSTDDIHVASASGISSYAKKSPTKIPQSPSMMRRSQESIAYSVATPKQIFSKAYIDEQATKYGESADKADVIEAKMFTDYAGVSRNMGTDGKNILKKTVTKIDEKGDAMSIVEKSGDKQIVENVNVTHKSKSRASSLLSKLHAALSKT